MRPLRSARQNSSSEGSLESDEDAPLSICRSQSAASYLLEADVTNINKLHFEQEENMAGKVQLSILYTPPFHGFMSCTFLVFFFTITPQFLHVMHISVEPVFFFFFLSIIRDLFGYKI